MVAIRSNDDDIGSEGGRGAFPLFKGGSEKKRAQSGTRATRAFRGQDMKKRGQQHWVESIAVGLLREGRDCWKWRILATMPRHRCRAYGLGRGPPLDNQCWRCRLRVARGKCFTRVKLWLSEPDFGTLKMIKLRGVQLQMICRNEWV